MEDDGRRYVRVPLGEGNGELEDAVAVRAYAGGSVGSSWMWEQVGNLFARISRPTIRSDRSARVTYTSQAAPRISSSRYAGQRKRLQLRREPYNSTSRLWRRAAGVKEMDGRGMVVGCVGVGDELSSR